MNFLKHLHAEGRDVILSEAQTKLLKVEDFIQKAVVADYKDADIKVDDLPQEWREVFHDQDLDEHDACRKAQVGNKVDWEQRNQIKLAKFLKSMGKMTNSNEVTKKAASETWNRLTNSMIKIAMHSEERYIGLPITGTKSPQKKTETTVSHMTPNLKMRLNTQNAKNKTVLKEIVGHNEYEDDVGPYKNLNGDLSFSTNDLAKTFLRTSHGKS